jgi:hypothetical protein
VIIRVLEQSKSEGTGDRMSVVGKIDSLWRYPVKSMRGEELDAAFVGFSGVYGDRVYALRSSAAPKGFPYYTGREQQQMLRYRAVYRNREQMATPPNLREAQALGPGITPLYADPADQVVDYLVRIRGVLNGFIHQLQGPLDVAAPPARLELPSLQQGKLTEQHPACVIGDLSAPR